VSIIRAGARVVVVGQGYVGLPVARAAVAAGYVVTGYDIDPQKIANLTAGQSPIEDVTDQDLAGMLATGRYRPTGDEKDLAGFDIALVTVPTPLRSGRPDLSAVLSAATTLSLHVRRGALVVLESTVAPGTTADDFLKALVSRTPLESERDFFVGFSPERIDPGNKVWTFERTPKLVSGLGSQATDLTTRFYSTICETVVPCSSAAVAEMAKLLENTYRHVNIALVNELGRHAHALGISIWDVVEAAKTKPYGFQHFYPGPGVGGHCLPVDPAYLSHQVEQTLGKPFDFVNLAMRVNDEQPDYVVERITSLLNAGQRSVNGSKILILGLAYKSNVGDMRETPAARIVGRLWELGAAVSVCDPHVVDASTQLVEFAPGLKVVELRDVASAAGDADVTVIVTDHDDFPYADIERKARLILDTRNRLTPEKNRVQVI
jgi:nucleotide sugar dehydrogenase